MDSKTGLLKNKTRILVTNSLTFLSKTDKIIVLKEGQISETGTFNELMERSGYFSELINQYSTNTSENEEDLSQIEKRIKSGTIKETNTDKTQLVEKEMAETGSVKLSVYMRYFKAVSFMWCIFVVINYMLYQTTYVGSSVWLAKWSKTADSGEQDSVFYLTIYGKFRQLISLDINYFYFLSTGALGLIWSLFVCFGWFSITRGVIKRF